MLCLTAADLSESSGFVWFMFELLGVCVCVCVRVRTHCCSAVWNLVSRVWLSDHFPVVSFSLWMSHHAWFCCTVILVMSSVLQFCLLIFSTFSSFSLFCFFLPLSALCDGACYERLHFFSRPVLVLLPVCLFSPDSPIVLTCVNHALSVRVCPCSSRLTKLFYIFPF